jgi:hypothetical protein
MYWEAGAQHHTPHFHAYYQEATAIFSIDPIELMEVPCRSGNAV